EAPATAPARSASPTPAAATVPGTTVPRAPEPLPAGPGQTRPQSIAPAPAPLVLTPPPPSPTRYVPIIQPGPLATPSQQSARAGHRALSAAGDHRHAGELDLEESPLDVHPGRSGQRRGEETAPDGGQELEGRRRLFGLPEQSPRVNRRRDAVGGAHAVSGRMP